MTRPDLSTLRMDRTEAPRRRRGRGWLAPLCALVVIASAATFVWPYLAPRAEVRTGAVVLDASVSTSAASFVEAAGWVEPDPWPVAVRPRVEGVVLDVLVLPGDPVVAGETILARLDAYPFEAAVRRALAAAEVAGADVLRAEARLAGAEAALSQNLALRQGEVAARREALREEHALLAARAALDAAEFERSRLEHELAIAERMLEGGAVDPLAVERARAALGVAKAEVDRRRHDAAAVEAAVSWDREALALAEEAVREPVSLSAAVVAAKRELEHARARQRAAEVDLAIAREELALVEVRAQASGTVMRVLAAPGDAIGPRSGALLRLYDPERLQVRVDVPLESVAAIRPGDPAEVRSAVLGPASVNGVVARVERESDLLKNTLQIKVRLEPGSGLVPETLVRARIRVQSQVGDADVEDRFWVPAQAVRDGAVFVFDPRRGGRARRVPVEVVREEGDRTLLRGDLARGQRVILDPVEDGDRVEEANP